MNTRYFKLYLMVAATILLQLGATNVVAGDRAYEVDWAAFNPEIKGATYVNSSEKCLECHEEYMQRFAINQHGINLMQKCESCHGPMSKHLDAPRRKPALVVSLSEKTSTLAPAQKSYVCLQCHEGTNRMNWNFSQHANAGNACETCHNIEAPKDPVLVKTTQTDVCFKCHQDKRAQMFRFSRHPVREGKVVCSSCHNPHGSAAPTNLVKNTVNEVCYQCHQEKRGPFLWEHQPVQEDCTICHDPHGSTQPRMLKVRPPMLCYQCHQLGGGHPSGFRDGSALPPGNSSSRYVLAKGCANCHTNVHGTNHPSGVRFQR